MAKRLSSLNEWALIGAQQRLEQLDQERKAILSAFPQLRRRQRTEAEPGVARPRRKRRLSADARRRISEAQKARWAKQKGSASKG